MELRDIGNKALHFWKRWKKDHFFAMKPVAMWRNARNFYQMLHRDHPLILISVIFGGIVTGVLPFFTLFFSSRILDALIISDIELAKVYIIILLAGRLILGCVDRIFIHIVSVLAKAGGNSVRKNTANKAFVIEYEKYETTETMDKVRRTKSFDGNWCIDEQIVQSRNVTGCFVAVICSVIFTGQLIIKACRNHSFIPYTVMMLLVFLLLMIGIAILDSATGKEFLKTVPGEARYQSAIKGIWYSALDVQNGKDIRLYKMQKLIGCWYKYWTDFWCDIWGGCISRTTLNHAWIAIFCQVIAACTFIYVGFGVLEGSISLGDVMLYTGAIATMTANFNDAVLVYNMVGARFELLDDFRKFISSSDMDYEGSLAIKKGHDCVYELEFKNVSFKYPGTEHYALRNVNLKLEVNRRLAIVGQNGAGKTTLVKLLCRLYEPTEGEILLNGINITKYSYEEYSSIFAVVFQDFRLFALPLDENIAGAGQVDEERCLKVLKDVGLKDTVMKWPEKQHTLLYKNLGEGINVSGGEAQKIAIARALYKDAPIVILDEPTAALDPLAEAEIYENFNELVHGKTSIFISHRMSSCKFCDEIIVLEDGMITQKGNHQELLRQDGLYSQLWNAQAQYYI